MRLHLLHWMVQPHCEAPYLLSRLFLSTRVRCYPAIHSVTWCHSDLCHKRLQKKLNSSDLVGDDYQKGRETWWWCHSLLSGIIKSLTEVKIHANPYWIANCPASSEARIANQAELVLQQKRFPKSLKRNFGIQQICKTVSKCHVFISSACFSALFLMCGCWNRGIFPFTGIVKCSVTTCASVPPWAFWECKVKTFWHSWKIGIRTQKYFCWMKTWDDGGMNHSSRFRALLPYYGKQMAFHHTSLGISKHSSPLTLIFLGGGREPQRRLK